MASEAQREDRVQRSTGPQYLEEPLCSGSANGIDDYVHVAHHVLCACAGVVDEVVSSDASDEGLMRARCDGDDARSAQLGDLNSKMTNALLRDHNLVGSMSRRGNCHDNAVAESFFQLLKRERARRQIYSTRDDARADVFIYIEMLYNPKRRHGTAGVYSPNEFERRHFQWLKSV